MYIGNHIPTSYDVCRRVCMYVCMYVGRYVGICTYFTNRKLRFQSGSGPACCGRHWNAPRHKHGSRDPLICNLIRAPNLAAGIRGEEGGSVQDMNEDEEDYQDSLPLSLSLSDSTSSSK